MGTSKLCYHNGRYKGSLTSDQCVMLERLIQLKETNGALPDLRNIIFNLDDADVERLIEDFEVYGRNTITVEKPIGELRDYQTIGVGFLYYAGSCILGDSVGMGKTVEVSGLLNLLSVKMQKEQGRPHRYLFCTEKKLVNQVHRELIKFTGEYVYPIYDATQGQIRQFKGAFDFMEPLSMNIIGSHNLIKSNEFIEWLGLYISKHHESPFDTIIIDESSVLGGSSSKIVDAFKTLRQYFTRVYFLNATPMETGLGVLYNQLNLLDNKYLPTKTEFQKEYVQMDYSGFYPRPTDKYKNIDKFRELVAYKYFASTRRDNGAVMDNCRGSVVLSPLTKEQKNLMRESQLTQMIFDCPSYIDDTIPFTEATVPKLASLKKLLLNECAEYKSIIVYVHFREAQYHIHEWCDKQGFSNRILNGETNSAEGETIIQEFKDGKYRILITNVQKGLNFGGCNCCIFYSIISNPSKMVQFEGRMTRGFDIYDKAVYILSSEGKEYQTLCSTVKDRVEAMEAVTNTDYSIVLALLKNLGIGADMHEDDS